MVRNTHHFQAETRSTIFERVSKPNGDYRVGELISTVSYYVVYKMHGELQKHTEIVVLRH